MNKRGEHTSGPARPDEKMGNELHRHTPKNFIGPVTSRINKWYKRVAKKKRRQHDRRITGEYE